MDASLYSGAALILAHPKCRRHREAILESDKCGCFYCLVVFEPAEIIEWTDEETTALCPKCGIDSVIGNKSSYPADDPAFLKAMHQHWFG